MSWSISLIGTKAAVLAKIDDEFAKHPLSDPTEQAIKIAAGALAKLAVADSGDDVALKLEASGSMSNYDAAKKTQQFKVEVVPLYGFVK